MPDPAPEPVVQAKPPEPAPAPSPPADALIVVPVRDLVMFPEIVAPIALSRQLSIAAAQQAAREQRQVLVVLQRDPKVDEPKGADLHAVGVVANILRYVTAPDGAHHIVCAGVQRVRITDYLEGFPYLVARGVHIPEPTADGAEVEARFLNLKSQALEVLSLLPQAPEPLRQTVEALTSAGALADLTAAYMDAEPAEKQQVLEAVELVPRLDRVSAHLARRLEVLRLSQEIGRQTQASLTKRQREVLLREQMAAIQRELGEDEGQAAEIAEIGKAIDEAGMPEEVEAQARKELRRLERTPEASAEHGMIRSYLDWLLELPWRLPETAPIEIAEARRVLDEDHFGLEKIKTRIVEYLAVRKLAPQGKAPILCFVGPPGVGKTSLGQSIARAMGRKFVRVSLGGVHDEAEIRGHRRTYVGALPGNIVQAIRKAGSRDCVMMLDEIDKMGSGVHGDPSAAMLEVLDPEQNGTFRDNYLAVPYDLSRVVFIATANMLETIPGPLRDRMEIISLAGYTAGEKLEIARRYLVRRQLEANGLTAGQAEIDDAALTRIIEDHTREAGVRSLEREVGRALRHAAVEVAEGKAVKVSITPENLADILGPPRFENETAMRTSVPGVATGLAWTPVGGDILFIEAARTPGGGKLILTGQLGDVMRESVQAALSLVKTRTGELGISADAFDKHDIHVHVPAGATPKDGPSAGVAMFIALSSLLTGRTVRSDTAMTGEISLRGLVLPVGGIKEKVVAAAAAGITRVMLPARNRRDFDDIPKEAREKLEFVWLEKVDDAVTAALDLVEPFHGETASAARLDPSPSGRGRGPPRSGGRVRDHAFSGEVPTPSTPHAARGSPLLPREKDRPRAPMIDIHYWPTPNGKKVTVLLEEAEIPYRIVPVHIGRGDQFTDGFLKISPNNRMPAMVDHEPLGGGEPISLFESGAIMLYLAEKAGRFWPQDPAGRYAVVQWVMWQMANQGPKLGENGHFRRLPPEQGDQSYALRRFGDETHRLYGVLNNRLHESPYLAGPDYTIADMISLPWTVNWKAQGIDIEEFPYFRRWFDELMARPAVQRGLAVTAGPAEDPASLTPEEQARRRALLYNQRARPVPTA